jgi:hypothetical protein
MRLGSEIGQVYGVNIQRFTKTYKYGVTQRMFYKLVMFRHYSVIFSLENIQNTA